MSVINRSRILNKPPTLTQTTHRPLQSSPKPKQRKKLISNLRLYNTSNNSLNNNNQSLRSTSVNNRTPNSWTFAMISHNSNLNSFNQLANNNSTAGRRTSSRASGSPLNFAAKNSTISSLQSLPKSNINRNNTNFSIPLRTNKPTRSTNKLLSSTRRPFLSRSINYNSFINSAKSNQTDILSEPKEALSKPADSFSPPNRKATTNQRSTTAFVNSGRPKSTLIAISTTSNQNPFNTFNPVQFMQNIFDQFFSSSAATPPQSGNALFPWVN